MVEWLGQALLRSPTRHVPGLRESPAHYRFALVRVLRDCRELVSWSEGPRVMTRAQAEERFQQIIPSVSVVQEPGEGLELRMVRGTSIDATKVFVGRPPGCATIIGTDSGELGQVTLRSPSRMINVPLTLVPDVRRPPMLREPPGQWTFQIKVGTQLMGTCGPALMEKTAAQNSANFLYSSVTLGGSVEGCSSVLLKAREVYQRIHQPVTIAAYRNGAYRFTWPPTKESFRSQVVAGTSEEDGVPVQWLGQVTLKSPTFARPGVPLVTSIAPTYMRPHLTEPPGQFTFRVIIDGSTVLTCGPRRLDTTAARRSAQELLYNIAIGEVSTPEGVILVGTSATVCTLDQTEQARTIWRRSSSRVLEIRASRNGVYRFTTGAHTKGTPILLPSYGFSLSGVPENSVPEEDGALGQVSAPITAGVFNLDLFTMQVLVNEVLTNPRNNLPAIRDDGILDQATCDRLLEIATGTFGQPDSQLADLVLAHPELNDLCRGQRPLPPPPPPEEVPQNPFEQCFVNFGETSNAIRSVQKRINAELSTRGYLPIPEDGVWNSITCGALYFLTLTQGVVAEGPGSPFDIPECPGGMTVPTTCPDRVVPTRVAAATGGTGGGGIGAGGLLLLAGAAIAGIWALTQVSA